jgi:tetratricopeptide (TPR) repeat protein
LTDDREQILSDLNKAIELYPRNLAAWRARGVYYLTTGQFDKALEDLQELLNRDPDDVMAHQAIAQALRQLKQYDKAMEHLDQVLESDPDSSLAYNLKARIEEEQGHLAAALEYLNEAVRVQPQDLSALLYRARLLAAQQQFDLASSDVEQVLRLRPDLPQAILLRSVILAAQDRYGEAIADLQTLLRQQPDSLELKMQIAALYEADQRPRKAIELYGEILASDAENWLALRRRGDAYLSVAKHAEAIRDYEAALQLHTDDAGLLNNLAWVLATSPHDALRDGKRSLELAQKACELTKYEAAHILSTLAASHAELGDFPAAIQWSEKAVALNSAQPQLAKELESYRAGKPWREEQQVDENTAELNVPLADESLPVFDDVPDLKQPDVKKSDDTPGTPPQPAPQSPESADGP